MQRTFIIQRHGNAVPGENDVMRPLSDKGNSQVASMQSQLKKLGIGRAHLVLSSIAWRALHTAVVTDGNRAPSALRELYIDDDKDGVELAGLFDQLGYVPYRAYHDADVTGAFERWSKKARHAINERLEDRHKVVRICGHFALSNALTLTFIPEEYVELRNRVFNTALGEACCIVLATENDLPIKLEILEP